MRVTEELEDFEPLEFIIDVWSLFRDNAAMASVKGNIDGGEDTASKEWPALKFS